MTVAGTQNAGDSDSATVSAATMARMTSSQRTATAGRPTSPTKPAAKMKKQLAPGLRGAVTRPMARIPKMTPSSGRPCSQKPLK